MWKILKKIKIFYSLPYERKNCSREQADIMVTALSRLEINKNYFIRFLMKEHKLLQKRQKMFSELKIKTIQALDRGSFKYEKNSFNAWSRETMKHAFID